MIAANLNLFNKELNWVDCLRQWFVLLMTIITTMYLVFAIREIRKAQQTVDIDQVILGIELGKVSPLRLNNHRRLYTASRLFCSLRSAG